MGERLGGGSGDHPRVIATSGSVGSGKRMCTTLPRRLSSEMTIEDRHSAGSHERLVEHGEPKRMPWTKIDGLPFLIPSEAIVARSNIAARLTEPELTGNQSVTDMHRARADQDVFRAIADPTRRAILDRLRVGPAPVNALAADFDQSRPAISKHLRVLRDTRLVTEERVGRERLYALNPAPLAQAAAWLEGYRAFWQHNLNRLKRYLEDT